MSTHGFSQEYRKRVKHELRLLYRGLCAYCAKAIQHDVSTIDHYVPVAHGGSSRVKNLRYCCWTCNNEKGNMMPDQWRAFRPLLVWVNPEMPTAAQLTRSERRVNALAFIAQKMREKASA